MSILQALKRGIITSAGFFLLLIMTILIISYSMIFRVDFSTFLNLYLSMNIIVLLTHIPLTIWREKKKHFKSDAYEDKLNKIEEKIDILLKKL